MSDLPKKILVIEDDQCVRELVVEVLQSEGYSVESVTDGGDALSNFEKGQIPDLILMDLNMPKMDGRTFRTHQLKNEKWSKIPLILMTADSGALIETIGATAYLKKPADMEDILDTVAACLKKN